MTLDEFWQHYAGQAFELVAGQAQPLADKGYLHEIITSRIKLLLSVFVETQYLGEVLGDGTRFALSDQDLLSVDAAFVSQARLQHLPNPEAYFPFPPDLMIEIVSPRLTSTQIQHKAEAFLLAGSEMVWVVDPDPEAVTLFYADGSIWQLMGTEWLDGGQALQGLRLQVNDLFPPLASRLSPLYS